MEAKVKQIPCPRCGKPNDLDTWTHSETGEQMEATFCKDCYASFDRYVGEPWFLVQHFPEDESYQPTVLS